jgi:hypothetical protein
MDLKTKNDMKKYKRLTAQKLLNFLKEIEADGNDLSLIKVNFSYDRDYGRAPIRLVFEEDYSADNKTLQSIVLYSKL